MPTLDLDREDLNALLGASPDDRALDALLAGLKAERKGTERGLLRVEVTDTNRPDLWSPEGIARAARGDEAGRAYRCFEPGAAPVGVRADAALRELRPYVQAFRARGPALCERALAALIQTQEKLAENFGRGRSAVSIGLYRAQGISFPVAYAAVDPGGVRMRALGDDRERTFSEIVRTHPKGLSYGRLLPAAGPVPVLRDARGTILSFPPIINSDDVGQVRAGDRDLLVEGTGTDLGAVLLALNCLAANLVDRGFTVEPLATEYPFDTPRGRSVRAPEAWGERPGARLTVAPADFARVLGDAPPVAEVADSLARMGHRVTARGESLAVELPPYRADAMHPVDLVEDYMLVRGVGSFPARGLETFTAGRPAREAQIEDRARDHLLGFGLEEVFSNLLCDRASLRERMGRGEGTDPVTIANPVSETFSVLRDSLLPGLLRTEGASADVRYPHRLFEVGEIVRPDPEAGHGSRTLLSAAVLDADAGASFTGLASMLAQWMRWLEVPYELRAQDDSAFLPGRRARILSNGEPIGEIGELHPATLERWRILVPCAVFEIDLERAFGVAARED